MDVVFAFVVIASCMAFTLRLVQQNRQVVTNDTIFTMVSIDREDTGEMIFKDQKGYVVVFRGSRAIGSRNLLLSYRHSAKVSVVAFEAAHSSASSQQTEPLPLDRFRHAYSNYMDTPVFVNTIIFMSIVWFIVLIGAFFEDGIYKSFRGRYTVNQAKWKDERLARLNGKTYTAALIIGFIAVFVFTFMIFNLPWWYWGN